MTVALDVAAAVMAAVAAALVFPGRPRRPTLCASSSTRPREVDRLLPLAAGSLAGLGAALFVGGQAALPAGVVAGLAGYLAVVRMEPPAARRRREAVEAGLPHAVDLLAACLAAGHAPGTAVDQVTEVLHGPLHDELAAVSARLRLGMDPVTVWAEVAGDAQLGVLGRTVVRAVDTGASVADAMARLADDLRNEARARVEARARAVGVRAALPLGVCLLPAFILLGIVPLVAGSLTVLSLP